MLSDFFYSIIIFYHTAVNCFEMPFEIAGFVHNEVYRIGVTYSKYIRNTVLFEIGVTKWNTCWNEQRIHFFLAGTLLGPSQEINFSCFIYFLDIETIRSGQTMKCLTYTTKHTIISKLFYSLSGIVTQAD